MTRNKEGIVFVVESKRLFCDMAEVVAVEVLCLNTVVFVCTQTLFILSKTSLMRYVITDISISNKGWNI